jgi:hypothetical protein
MESTETQGRRISVTFERKKSVGDYETATARGWVEDDLPEGATDADIAEQGVELLNAVKVAVYDSLGIEVFKDDTGVIREKHAPVATVKQAADAVGTQFGGTQSFNTGGLKVMNPQDLVEDIPTGIVAKCNQLGITAVWANNGKYGPFYKEAVKQGETPLNPNPQDPSKAGILKG